MRNYYFTSVSVSVSVSGSGADSVLCSWLWVLFFLLEDLSFCFGFWVFDFAFFLGFWISISGYWMFVLYYEHQGKLSVFYILWFWFILWLWFLSCASVLKSVFLFWGLFFIFGFCGVHFPYRPRYIFDRRISVNLFTGGILTRLSISWQFRQEKAQLSRNLSRYHICQCCIFFFDFSLVQLKVNLWLRPVDDSQSTRDTPLY